MEEAEDSSLMNPSTFKQPSVRKQKILPQSIPSKEAEDSFLVSPIHQKFPARKQKILPQSPQRTMKEVENSSLVGHKSTLLLSESIHTTPQRVSHPHASHERLKIPPHAHLLLNEFSPSLVDLIIKTTRAHILRELNM